ncbi:hypothetical protein [Halomonas cerina]|uniref:Uncharacterized protein n=1 Tax=Halomonas cerina TaxID=447424 RepID=A0A839V209_9GAMM|nr:hypothetical protein [Halomonas cerina]MBB3189211.1 hypothetical protein [Halomonas cerina]
MGVENLSQPDDQFPKLEDGNHLRWAFSPHRGFPRHGYSLFRRLHIAEKISPFRLSEAIDGLAGRKALPLTITAPEDRVHPIELSGPDAVRLSDDYRLQGERSFDTGTDNRLEIQLTDQPLRIRFPEPMFKVVLLMAPGRAEATATAWQTTSARRPLFGFLTTDEVEVDTTTIGEPGHATLSFNAIDGITIQGDGATLVDILLYPVADKFSENWQPVPGLRQPIGLPVFPPRGASYPVGLNSLQQARHTAADRIAYGDSAYFTQESGGSVSDGQASVTRNWPIVVGTGTRWTRDLAGQLIQMDGDDTAYLIVEALLDEQGPDRILLSRPYEGQGGSGRSYSIRDDHFAQLHDYLAQLVDDDQQAGGMAGRVVPRPVVSDGSVRVTDGQPSVSGVNVAWSVDLVGLHFRVGRVSGGTVDIRDGEFTVRRSTSETWNETLVGLPIRFEDQHALYTIAAIDPQDTTRLWLDRPYAGPDIPQAGFTVYEGRSYRIERVDSDNDELTLADPYRWTEGSISVLGTRPYLITGEFASPTNSDDIPPRQSLHYALDMVLLASLEPAVAQLLGLYAIDREARPDQTYDYLIVADHDGSIEYFGGLDNFAPGELFSPHEETDRDVDGYIVFDVKGNRAPEPLGPPQDIQVYELPGTRYTRHTLPNGETRYGQNAAGVRWRRNTSPGGRLLPREPLLYHLWRHGPVESEPSEQSPPPPEGYDRLLTVPPWLEDGGDGPVLVVDPVAGSDEAPPGWPDRALYGFDAGLLDGWYSYRVSGVDLFGRVSERSEPGAGYWRQADTPAEDYWETPARRQHSAAVYLKDRRPPPSPRGVEATLVGDGQARVSWIWPQRFMEQAPDVREFRIHFRPGPLNHQLGVIDNVTDQGHGRYTIDTDIAPASPADGYAGATFYAGDTPYRIIASRDDGGRLQLEIVDHRPPEKNTLQRADGNEVRITATDSRPNVAARPVAIAGGPEPGVACTVAIPPVYKRGRVNLTHGRREVNGRDTHWTEHLEGQAFTTPDGGDYTVDQVVDDGLLRLDRPYQIPDPARRPTRFGYAYTIAHPIRIDYSRPAAWPTPTSPADWSTDHATVGCDDTNHYETVSENNEVQYRRYEVTLPVPGTGDPQSDPFAPDAARPVVYAHFGVSALDHNDNQGAVSAPVRVARAKQTAPPAPEAPTFSSAIDWATPPDYHGKAHYTVRWRRPGEHLKTHVYRVMDKTLFRRDWQQRQNGMTQDVSAEDTDKFPADRQGSDTEPQREEIVSVLNILHGEVKQAATFEVAFEHYQGLEPDTLQVIAALPHNQGVYSQITIDPLDPEEHPNQKGPDYQEGDPTGSQWCAWIHAFDGRSRRRYFYRTGNVDKAHNRSGTLSYPTPPVQAIDTVAPKAPVVTKAVAGHYDNDQPDDGAITLRWTANPEPDIAMYLVYRTQDKALTRDVRLMGKPVATVPQPAHTRQLEWADESRPAGARQYYRLVAVDQSDKHSRASRSMAAQAFDLKPPEPPTIDVLKWVLVDSDGNLHPHDASVPDNKTWRSAVQVSWSSSNANLRSLVQVRVGSGGRFQNASGWLESGLYKFIHFTDNIDFVLEYRLKVRNNIGKTNSEYETKILQPMN